MKRETLVDLPCALEDVVPATELRGTIVTTSMSMVRECGLADDYFRHLPRPHHEAMRAVTAITWVPVDLALHHYRVMDRLFPTAAQQVENGRLSSERTQNAYLRTMFKLARSAGKLDPATALKRLPSVFGRMWNGGGAPTAYRTGPKDARVELYGYPIVRVDYVRHGWQGMLESGLSLTAKRVYVRIDRAFEQPDSVAYDVSWV